MGAADELLTRYLVSERVTVHNGRQQTKNSMKVTHRWKHHPRLDIMYVSMYAC